MKIGILTVPFNNNYGGYLQAYALMTVLKGEGHDVELIYRRHNKPPFIQLIIPTCKNLVKRLLGREVISIIPDSEKEFRARGEAMMPFFDDYIVPRSKPLFSSREFAKFVSGRYDAVIVGSDQVWRPDYVPCIRDFFLGDVPDENLIRLSYAASFGSDKPMYTEEEVSDCRNAVRKFKGVSVREKSGLDIIEEYVWKTSVAAVETLDPTFLLPKEKYMEICSSIPKRNKIVFAYILDKSETIVAFAQKIAREKGCDLVYVERDKGCFTASVEQWLAYFRDSEFVITDSYHGTVFSVIFHKEYICFYNATRGKSRMESLQEALGIEDRFTEAPIEIPKKKIEYDIVDKRLEKMKVMSMEYLKTNLSK